MENQDNEQDIKKQQQIHKQKVRILLRPLRLNGKIYK